MTMDELEALQAIRVLLAVGVFFVLAVLIADNLSHPPAVATRQMKVPVDEECKLHARRLSECTRLGYHAEDAKPNEEGDDDSAG